MDITKLSDSRAQILVLSGSIYLLVGPACAGPAKLGLVFLATGVAQHMKGSEPNPFRKTRNPFKMHKSPAFL